MQLVVLDQCFLEVAVDDVADGNQADDFLVFHYGKVADFVLGHDLHDVIDFIVGKAANQVGGHDVGDFDFGELVEVPVDFAKDVALGDDPDGVSGIILDQEGADCVVAHESYGFDDLEIRPYEGDDGIGFFLEYVFHFHFFSVLFR